MNKFLVKLGLWLARAGGWQAVIVPSLPIACEAAQLYVVRATELTVLEDARDSSGESKRHQVYARLLKDYPEARKRHLALAIELALN